MASQPSVRKRAARVAKATAEKDEHPGQQLYAIEHIQSTLNQHVKEMHAVMSLHATHAVAFCQHHFEVSQNMQLENRQLRTNIASVREAMNGRKSSRSQITGGDAETLLGKQHAHAMGLLVKRDMQARAALAENYELRELLSASQAFSEPRYPLNSDRSPTISEPTSPTSLPPAMPSSARMPSLTSLSSSETAGSDGLQRMRRLTSPSSSEAAGSDGGQQMRRASGRGGGPLASMKVCQASPSNLIEDIKLPGQAYDSSTILEDGSSSSSEDDHDRARHVLEAGVTVKSMDMKDKMRQVLSGKRYNVTDFYYQTGRAQFMARHHAFELFTMAVVSLNVIWIGIDATFNDSDLLINSDAIFVIVENLFCALFTAELAVRFAAFKSKLRAFKDFWFFFDAIILFFMVMETWLMTVIMLVADTTDIGSFSPGFLRLIRVLKFCRMARLARLLRNMPEIMILLKGLGVALRSIACTVCLLTLVIYIFAIAFKQLCKDTAVGNAYFSNLGVAMLTLFFNGCLFEGVTDLAKLLFAESTMLGLLLLLFLLVSPLTIMNMLVGVLVQVVDTVASCEQESAVSLFLEDHVSKTVQQIDGNSSGQIDECKFLELLRNPDSIRTLAEVGIDVLELIDEPSLVFQDASSLPIEHFVQKMMLLRGSNTATLRDVILLRKSLLQEVTSLLNQTQYQVFEKSRNNKNNRLR